MNDKRSDRERCESIFIVSSHSHLIIRFSTNYNYRISSNFFRILGLKKWDAAYIRGAAYIRSFQKFKKVSQKLLRN